MTAHEAMASRRALLTGALGVGALGGVGLMQSPAEAKIGDPTLPEGGGERFFLRLAGIPGESTRESFPNWIEVLTYGWGVTNTGSAGGGGGGGAGKTKRAPLLVAGYSGKHSPKVFQAVATGKHIKDATLRVLRDGESPQVFYEVVLADVLVSSLHATRHPTFGSPMDVFEMDYAKLTHTTWQQNNDGTLSDPVTFGFDFVRNRAI